MNSNASGKNWWDEGYTAFDGMMDMAEGVSEMLMAIFILLDLLFFLLKSEPEKYGAFARKWSHVFPGVNDEHMAKIEKQQQQLKLFMEKLKKKEEEPKQLMKSFSVLLSGLAVTLKENEDLLPREFVDRISQQLERYKQKELNQLSYADRRKTDPSLTLSQHLKEMEKNYKPGKPGGLK